jgi:AcrR family transcriptional regulator
MSKATFYEHFANKEEAILALFDDSSTRLLEQLVTAVRDAPDEPAARMRAGLHAFVAALNESRDAAQTFLVEIIGAGPRAAERRDAILERFAAAIDAENARAAGKYGAARFRSPHDAYALVGAAVELCSRQLRLGEPPNLLDLEPVIERLAMGLLDRSA